MLDEMMCPDCGGVVGASETTEAGPPCRCFTAPAGSGSGLSALESDDSGAATQSGAPKICIVCGKDVAGHRRVKDSRGYTCYDCAKEEIRKERGDRVRCRSCSRLTKESLLQNYEGTPICPQCFAERQRLQKTQIKRHGIQLANKRFEFGRIGVLAGIGAFLLLIIILHSLLHVF